MRWLRSTEAAVPLLLLPVPLAPLLDREPLLRCPAGAGHDRSALLDEVARVGVAVLVRLHASPRVALDVERVRIALLLVRAVVLVRLRPRALSAGAASELVSLFAHRLLIAHFLRPKTLEKRRIA